MLVLPPKRETCVSSTLRAASRYVSQLYDDALAPLGLTITGYSLLSRVDKLGKPSLNELADDAAMERSTLSRNLKPLLGAKLLKMTPGADRRRKEFALTAAGRAVLRRAYPIWQGVQERFRRAYGVAEAQQLTALLERAIDLTP
jgi:DNA-binding MarR family transcriptional regulator